eukprot:gene2613-biopygen4200
MDPLRALAALQDELACPIWDCIINTLEGPGIVKSQCFVCKQPAWKKELVRNHKYDAIKESLLQLAGILQLQGHVEEAQQDEEQLAGTLLQQHVDQQQQDQGQQQQQQQVEGCLQQLAEAEAQAQHMVPPQLTLQEQLAGDNRGHDAVSLQTAPGVGESPSHPAGCLRASTPPSAGLSEAPGFAPDATRPEAAMSSEAGRLSRLGSIAVPPPAAAAAAVHATAEKTPAAATELTNCCAAEAAGQDLGVPAVDHRNDDSTQQQQQQMQEQPQQRVQDQQHLLCCQPKSTLPGSDEQLPGSAYWQFQQLVVNMRHSAELVWTAADACQLQPPQVAVQLPRAFFAAVQELPTPSGHLLQRLQEDLQHIDALLADVTSALVAQAAVAATDPAAQQGEQTAGCNGAMLLTTSVSAAECGHSRVAATAGACCKQQNEPAGADICEVALQHLNVNSLARQTVRPRGPCAATAGAPPAGSPGSSSHGCEEQQQEQQQEQEQQQREQQQRISALPDKGLMPMGRDAAAVDQAARMSAAPDAPTAKRRRLRLGGRRSGSSAGAYAGGCKRWWVWPAAAAAAAATLKRLPANG